VFGGENLDQLYVTTASEALMTGEQALLGDQGGSVFRIDLSEVLGGSSKGIVKPEFDG
jgi:sugar lactone lactonase YvrE